MKNFVDFGEKPKSPDSSTKTSKCYTLLDNSLGQNEHKIFSIAYETRFSLLQLEAFCIRVFHLFFPSTLIPHASEYCFS